MLTPVTEKINKFVVRYYKLYNNMPQEILIDCQEYYNLSIEVAHLLKQSGRLINIDYVSVSEWNGIPVVVVVKSMLDSVNDAFSKRYHIRKRRNANSRIRKR